MDQKIKELADSFFEWPTENKSFVTLTSALLFTENIAEITRNEERERCALLCEMVGTEIGECPEAYQYCADAIRYRADHGSDYSARLGGLPKTKKEKV